jgi:antitoxin ParD1/3/4
MPNVSFTDPMEKYVQKQIKTGAYANVSEVVRAGMRLLMEKDEAKQFYALKADLEIAVIDAEKGNLSAFDPKAYEPDAF